jgi:tetratricopeptide (TPR) repeat protein
MKYLPLLLPFLLLAAFAAPAQATETEFQSLLLSRQPSALETLARERLARDPLDDAALWYWGQQSADDPRVRAELLPRAQACVRDRPQSARCQHLLGLLIGAELMDSGGFSAMRRIGEVREQFERAVALAPQDYAMRRDLQGFYLEVPALMGGSGRKAREQAEAFARIDAPRGVLLQAVLDISNKAFDAAEQRLAGVQPGADRQLAGDLQAVQVDLGLALLDDEAPVRARAWFERLLQQDTGSPELNVGLGRALLALKQPTAAAAAFERALQLNPKLRIHHRLAAAYEAAGQNTQAIAAYRRVLDEPASSAAADKARERLKALQR